MRLLDDEVLELIGGGMDYVYVYAPYPDPPSWDPPYDPPPPVYDPNPTDPGSTGGGGQGDGQHHCPHTSAPTGPTPANVDLNNLRNLALDVADQINHMDSKLEHASMLIRESDGSLRSSAIVSSTLTDGFTLDVQLSAGETIVGYIHNHPDVAGVDERTMSTPNTAAHPEKADTLQAAALAQNSRSDPNLLVYILDTKSGDTFEYPATVPAGIDVPRPVGPDVSKDSIPCG